MGVIDFRLNPQEEFKAFFEEIERKDLPPYALDENIEDTGRMLYDGVFPDVLRQQYWKIRNSIESIQVITNEPWIPWEIIKPYRNDYGVVEEDLFLSEKYPFSRWTDKDYVSKERISNVKLVVPYDTNLSSPQEARKWIEQFSKKALFEVSVDITYVALMNSLKTGGFELLHISTHGNFDSNTPALSPLALEEGREIRPENISGIAMSFGKNKPLVILDACKSGVQGFSLTGIQSWATRFLE